ncbi:MAG: phenylalanine--tRNA ligase subunit beta [Nitrospirota bacterium]
MRIPYEWLREIVDISSSPDVVAERLTMIGFEVEAVESVEDDIVFEINVTPNRPDCLSILGIAREISAAFNVLLKVPQHEIKGEQPVSDFSIEILRPELCSRYAGRLIKDVNISESPEWIKRRLEKCGIRTINNVVDITNYVLLEFGHPLHAFDADTINDKKIIVNTAGKNNKIITLDEVERPLPEDALLIWDSVRPVAVAGIMGGLNTEVTKKTKNIFLESAYFAPFSVRRTSRRLNITSESSYRFERGTDIEFLENAMNRAAVLINEVAGGTIYKMIDAYPAKYKTEPVVAGYERINKILGTNLSNTDMLGIMEKLGIRTEDRGDTFLAYLPSFRRDIQRDNDIAEEVARFYGYDRIPTTLPRSAIFSGQSDKRLINIKRIREAMRKAGFTEVINYSFMNPYSLDLLDIPETDIRRNTIVISNPLRQEESLLRTTLVPALIENFKYNLDRGIKDIRFFEIARVFKNIDKPLPSEELRIGGIFYKDKFPSLWKEDTRGFFITKGVVESMFEELKISGYSFSPSSEPFLHKGASSDISVSDSCIGYIGVISPEIIERLDLKRQKPEVVLFDLSIDLLLKFIPHSIKYSQIPKYPYVERDIAVVVDEGVAASEIEKIIKTFPSEFIEEVSVFDYYKGGNIPQGKKSIAFNIIYRSKDKTLTDEEVEKLHASMVDYMLEKTGGELRR